MSSKKKTKLPADLIHEVHKYTPVGSREAHILSGLVRNRPGGHAIKPDPIPKKYLFKEGGTSSGMFGWTPPTLNQQIQKHKFRYKGPGTSWFETNKR
jgi:hypothetical protein